MGWLCAISFRYNSTYLEVELQKLTNFNACTKILRMMWKEKHTITSSFGADVQPMSLHWLKGRNIANMTVNCDVTERNSASIFVQKLRELCINVC